jgi:hypothetical protein
MPHTQAAGIDIYQANTHDDNKSQGWPSAVKYTTLGYVLGMLLPVVQIGLQSRVSGCMCLLHHTDWCSLTETFL